MSTVTLPVDLAGGWTDLLRLVGDDALMLHAPDSASHLSGIDFDTAVFGLDRSWPLRLTGGWSLCQCVHYDLLGWYWVLERDGNLFALDTIIDPNGLGRDGFPTKLFRRSNELEASPAVRGAYLTAKRIRKEMPDESEWQRIGVLARENRREYLGALEAILGSRVARLISDTALRGQPPELRLLRRAHALQWTRRFRTPARAIRAMGYGVRRTIERVRQPTGLHVVIVGPDGVGKSSLARELPPVCGMLFRRVNHSHWRPGILPRPAVFLGREESDPSQPHGREPHGRVTSQGLLLYFWLDFLVGTWTKYAYNRVRCGLVVVERGWWDIAADPRRYRLDVRAQFVHTLGRALPRPDVAIVLHAPSATLVERKQEIGTDELDRQLAYWRSVSPAKLETVRLETDRQPDAVVEQARQRIASTLERRTAGRVGAGWANIAGGRPNGWYLPRGDRRTAMAALSVHHPLTGQARVGWSAARTVARAGGFRLLRRGEAPPREVRELVAPYVPPRGSIAVSHLTHPHRYAALILDGRGTPQLLAKITTSDDDVADLAAEVSTVECLGSLLPAPVRAPRVVAHEPGVVVYQWVDWIRRPAPSNLPEEVAFALGKFFRATRQGSLGGSHGDFAPWNLLRDAQGWVLLDWEGASAHACGFHDICHWMVQAHALLGRPSERAIVDGFRAGSGIVGSAIRVYASGADLEPVLAEAALRSYLAQSAEMLESGADRARGAAVRERLLRRLER